MPNARLLAVVFAVLASTRRAHGGERVRDAPEDRVEHVRAGALVGVGFPQPLMVEGLVKFEGVVSLGLQYGVLPEIQFEDVTLESTAIAGDLRIFPLRSAFFLGLRAGKQRARTRSVVDLPRYGELEAVVDIDSWFLNPRIGFLWTLGPGVTLGIDAGVQVPISHSTSSNLPARVHGYWEQPAERFGRAVLPTMDILQLGLLL